MFREKSSLLTTSSTAPRPDAAPSSPGGGSLARKRVMIVEDEALIALDLERRLARLGFEVAGVADNLEDAVALYTSTLPDLVLMDIFIRGPADGIDTARAIGKLGDPLVLFLTAYADEDTVRRAAETSPYGYLLKPFDERTLSRVWLLRQLLHPLNVIDSMEFLLDKIRKYETNQQFLDGMNQ